MKEKKEGKCENGMKEREKGKEREKPSPERVKTVYLSPRRWWRCGRCPCSSAACAVRTHTRTRAAHTTRTHTAHGGGHALHTGRRLVGC